MAQNQPFLQFSDQAGIDELIFFKLSVLGTEVINVHYTLDRELFYCTWAQ